MIKKEDTTIFKRGTTGKKLAKQFPNKKVKLKFKNKSVVVTKNILIGRDKECRIPLTDDPLVSRRHALIEKKDDNYYIHDLDSTNGTYLNGNPVKKGTKKKINSGDIIKIGKYEFSII